MSLLRLLTALFSIGMLAGSVLLAKDALGTATIGWENLLALAAAMLFVLYVVAMWSTVLRVGGLWIRRTRIAAVIGIAPIVVGLWIASIGLLSAPGICGTGAGVAVWAGSVALAATLALGFGEMLCFRRRFAG